ncbi:ABC transporter permease [Brooklawnia cerclae]|uniref:Oligopeptide transport system permease protein n=1 Tax=Brooklawnia cerclae TaxID=349934 RepID=A0ABX0SLA0_9ACTN|nr:ABC transporter permease [Brooklawnia cerclae]NIH58720.1 oligopeptide transport system permease protein [Brooklawnia cerclae]
MTEPWQIPTDGTNQLAAPEAGAEEDAAPAGPPEKEVSRSLGRDAWDDLRKRPAFWVSSALIVIMVLMAAAPTLFTFFSPQPDPTYADLSKARQTPSAQAWFGYDGQGYDVYSRTIFGARASILVGVLTTILTTILGSVAGLVSGFFGGWIDAVLSRLGEIFWVIPLLLGGVLFLYTFPSNLNTPYMVVIGKVVLVLSILGWPRIARIMRSTVLQVKPLDYVQAARALGASPWQIIVKHVLPNAFTPVIVVATIDLGAYIATEATLSFLGIGLQPPTISWGVAISEASGLGLLRSAPHMLLFPSIFLSITVLAFIMLGDAVRDAFDPKGR